MFAWFSLEFVGTEFAIIASLSTVFAALPTIVGRLYGSVALGGADDRQRADLAGAQPADGGQPCKHDRCALVSALCRFGHVDGAPGAIDRRFGGARAA
ncbi:MAG: hypothetical protein ACN6I5_03995 [Hyphomicrobiales bacterium]